MKKLFCRLKNAIQECSIQNSNCVKMRLTEDDLELILKAITFYIKHHSEEV